MTVSVENTIAWLIERFFKQRLMRQGNLSTHTVTSYHSFKVRSRQDGKAAIILMSSIRAIAATDLAPSIVEEMFEVITTVKKQDVAILLVAQNISKALSIASRAYLIEQGRTVASGAPDILLARPEIRAAFLGV